jgi:hypothetical protein
MVTDNHENADEVLNRKRFSDLRSALRAGRSASGVCPMHGIMTDAQVLQLEASEAILVDVRDLRISVSGLRQEVQAGLSRQNAVAGAEVELEAKVGMMTKAARVLHPVSMISLAVIVVSVCYTILQLKG